ncbi:MAG: hypothetical protein EZS28_035165, partial [Streblomastix strix]
SNKRLIIKILTQNKLKTKQITKIEPSKTKPKTSEIKQEDIKDQQAYSEEEIEHDNRSDTRSESTSSSEVSGTDEQQTPYHSDRDSSSLVSKQNKTRSKTKSHKGENVESENNQKADNGVISPDSIHQSSEESKGVTQGSIPPSIEDEDMERVGGLIVLQKSS